MKEGRLPPALTWGFFGADDGIRTRDPHLGKVVLYQLSHVRVTTHSTNGHVWSIREIATLLN